MLQIWANLSPSLPTFGVLPVNFRLEGLLRSYNLVFAWYHLICIWIKDTFSNLKKKTISLENTYILVTENVERLYLCTSFRKQQQQQQCKDCADLHIAFEHGMPRWARLHSVLVTNGDYFRFHILLSAEQVQSVKGLYNTQRQTSDVCLALYLDQWQTYF